MKRFPLGVHLPVDDVREWVVSGIAYPVPHWTQETTRQFTLARQSAAYVARLYHENGFAAAIDDVISVDDAKLFDVAFANLPFYKVLLSPPLQSTLERFTHQQKFRYIHPGRNHPALA